MHVCVLSLTARHHLLAHQQHNNGAFTEELAPLGGGAPKKAARLPTLLLFPCPVVAGSALDCAWLRFEEKDSVKLVRKAGKDLRVVRCVLLLTHSDATTSQRRAPAPRRTALYFPSNLKTNNQPTAAARQQGDHSRHKTNKQNQRRPPTPPSHDPPSKHHKQRTAQHHDGHHGPPPPPPPPTTTTKQTSKRSAFYVVVVVIIVEETMGRICFVRDVAFLDRLEIFIVWLRS